MLYVLYPFSMDFLQRYSSCMRHKFKTCTSARWAERMFYFILRKRIFLMIHTTTYLVFNFCNSYISFVKTDPIMNVFELLKINYFHIQNFPDRFIVGNIKIPFAITDCGFSLGTKWVLFLLNGFLGMRKIIFKYSI